MKIKLGLKFKCIEGLSKNKLFTVVYVDSNEVHYKSDVTGKVYISNRKHFEKYLQRVNKYWNDTNKKYKLNKRNMV